MNIITNLKRFVVVFYLKATKYRNQKVFVGNSAVFDLVKEIKKKKLSKLLIVTSSNITKLNLLGDFLSSLKANNIDYSLFEEVEHEPSIEVVEHGLKKYNDNKCDSIVAFGGGSVIDCSKVIGLRVSNPKKSVIKLNNLLSYKRFSPPIMAIPTTSGTGSEVTFYALITNPDIHKKYPIFSNKYMPNVIALDPKLTVNLPLSITAYTAMDALTHAIESYISIYSKYFKADKQEALDACKMIMDNIEKVYNEPTNLKYRENMAVASYKAGLAFRKISVGYVHSFAHRAGEFYHVPHGLANAIILPYILEYSLPYISKSLSELAVYSKLGNKEEDELILANRFIEKIKQLNKTMKIPLYIKEINENDYEILIKRILHEGSLCGTPFVMTKNDCKNLLVEISGRNNEK